MHAISPCNICSQPTEIRNVHEIRIMLAGPELVILSAMSISDLDHLYDYSKLPFRITYHDFELLYYK
ncbi:hypothetical protein VYA_16990 [Vibrio alfacsensis]|nr:hypothetical protein VYA_16990 [Vibrio alfacsensis]